MNDNIVNCKNAIKLPLRIEAWKLISNSKNELIQLELKPGESIEKHINPINVIFYTLNGTGELVVEDTKYTLSTGDCIEIDNELNRAWYNKGNEVLRLLVIKTF